MISAAMGFALGGIGAKVLREADMDAFRLTQIRTTGAALILLTFAFISGREQLRIKKSEIKDLMIHRTNLDCPLLKICTQEIYFTIDVVGYRLRLWRAAINF